MARSLSANTHIVLHSPLTECFLKAVKNSKLSPCHQIDLLLQKKSISVSAGLSLSIPLSSTSHCLQEGIKYTQVANGVHCLSSNL